MTSTNGLSPQQPPSLVAGTAAPMGPIAIRLPSLAGRWALGFGIAAAVLAVIPFGALPVFAAIPLALVSLVSKGRTRGPAIWALALSGFAIVITVLIVVLVLSTPTANA